MAIEITEHRELVPAVLDSWAGISEAEIAFLASKLWHAKNNRGDLLDQTGESDLLVALQMCKQIDRVGSLQDLYALWEAVYQGPHGADFGALLQGEQSRNHGKVCRFVEGMFLKILTRLMEEEFDRLTIAASRLPSREDRIRAFELAHEVMQGPESRFEFSDASTRKLERMMEAKPSLLEQLIDAEEDVDGRTGEPPRKEKTKRGGSARA